MPLSFPLSLPLRTFEQRRPSNRLLHRLAPLAAFAAMTPAIAAPVDFGCGNCSIDGTYRWSEGDITTFGFVIGSSEAGSWLQSGGSVLLSDAVRIGSSDGLNGVLALGGGSFASQLAFVGYGGVGALLVSGGLFATSELYVGYGAAGTMTLTGGRVLVAGDAQVGGPVFTGSVTLSGGDHAIGRKLTMADTGSLVLTGGRLTVYGGADIAGTTSLLGGTLRGAVNHTAGTLTLGNTSIDGALVTQGSTARVNVTGGAGVIGGVQLKSGTLQVASGAFLAASGSGIETLADSAVQLDGGSLGGSGAIVIGGSFRGRGAITGSGGFTNAGQLVQTGALRLANTGSLRNRGSWTIGAGNSLQIDGSGERFVNAGTLTLGGGSITGGTDIRNQATGLVTGSGTIGKTLLNGGELRVASGEVLNAGAIVNGSAGRINGAGRIGGAIDNRGLITVASGTLTLTDALNNGTDALVSVGGGGASPATLALPRGTSSSAGSILLTDGTLDLSGQVWQNNGTLAGQGTVLARRVENSGQLQPDAGRTTVQGDFANTGTVTLQRGSFLTITGRTDLRSGSKVTGFSNTEIEFLGKVSVAPTASFDTGVALNFHDDLDLAGNDAMTLTAGGATLSFLQRSTLRLSLGGTASSAYDQLRANHFVFGGTLDVNLVGGYAPTAGASFKLFGNGNAANLASNGDFASLDFTSAALANGLAWDASSLYTTGTLRVITAVPEPAGAPPWLAGLAVVGAVAWRRRPTATA